MLNEVQMALLRSRSLLGLLFHEQQWPEITKQFSVKTIKAGELLFREGDLASFCFIALDGDIELFSELNGELIVNGLVKAGRSANTY